MSLEENLRRTLQAETEGWSAPPELKGKILNGISPGQGGRRMKKWLVATIIAASLIIPTGVYAGYNYLADSVYGSQDNYIQNGGTLEQYDQLEAKLQQAKQSLSKEDFQSLTRLLHEIGGFNLQITDAAGVLHPEKLSAADQERYHKLAAELEPYFSKLVNTGAPQQPLKQMDSDTFWEQQLAKAKQTFSGKELAKFQQLISEFNLLNAKATDPDGSTHPERFTKADLNNQSRLTEELNPYLKKLGIMLKPIQ
ncbi:hypothetical protein A3844_20615 [Paenibacillus helianthi]|uniref:DUF3600 domain-containing protein n=1 Tax=Paenibacillus helianthi TaxID=1349432 RepID=A0ABX3EK00_9BACL|nr:MULTISPECIES: DUF3600 domain-containing protein [Paenibacillus]OKP83984.1 hypothetical protein A3844_20615 [Paenibacillus helianthi]OKP94713.1 hypothetical protein A3848_01650 [Paenibacillus sp. P32E]